MTPVEKLVAEADREGGDFLVARVNGVRLFFRLTELRVSAADGHPVPARSASLTLRPGAPPQLYLDVSPQK